QEGLCFGGEDLVMGNSPKKWHIGKSHYEIPIRDEKGWFYIDEYEVFQVIKDD
ncbi:16180_t:CDS:1, partial [Dentiscutata erythropus]